MGLSSIFDIARRSLGVYQSALGVTSHNIANAANENYSRQRILFGTETPDVTAGFVWGTGVKITDINRIRDSILDAQLRTNNQKYSSSNRQSNLLSQVESVFSEPSDLGLSNLTSKFFSAWNELSSDSSSATLRDNVIQAASQFSSKVKSIHDDLNSIQADMISEMNGKVANVNGILKNIQSLNQQIFTQESVGKEANDLLDLRDKAIDDLSGLVNMNVSYNDKNIATISIGGAFAVDASQAIEFKTNIDNGKLGLVSADGKTKVTLTSGELFAVSDTYSNKIPKYLSKLDSIVNTLFTSVNDAHKSGFSLDDPPQTGLNFFDSYINGELKINKLILDDPSKISASADGTSGNGDIASKISELQNQKIFNGTTITDNYSSLVSGLGSDKQTSDTSAQSYSLVLSQLSNQKSSLSGVSVDEEMTNIITYQRAYDASAKLITIADQMLQTLIEMV
jgi:flagellar hook-associated protein 1 FlgK